jgi:hypothetical protein
MKKRMALQLEQEEEHQNRVDKFDKRDVDNFARKYHGDLTKKMRGSGSEKKWLLIS